MFVYTPLSFQRNRRRLDSQSDCVLPIFRDNARCDWPSSCLLCNMVNMTYPGMSLGLFYKTSASFLHSLLQAREKDLGKPKYLHKHSPKFSLMFASGYLLFI